VDARAHRSAHRRASRARGLGEVHRDGLDEVLLSAYGAHLPHADEDVAARDAVALRGALREEQEAAVDAGVAQDERVAVDADRGVHHGHDEVLGDVHDAVQVDARGDAHALEDRDEHLGGGVAGAGTEAGAARVDAIGPGLEGGEAVGHTHREVVVAVEADARLGAQRGAQGLDARGHVGGQHEPRGVGAVDDLGAEVLEDARLLRQGLGVDHVGHHQEAHGLHAHLAAHADVLSRDVGLRAVGRHAEAADTAVCGHPEVVDGADAGERQR
jgi:hypothetical protein